MFRVVSKHWQFIQDRHYHCARNRSPPHYTAIAVNLAYTNTNMRPVIWYNVTALSIFLSSLGQDKWQMDFSRHFQSRFVPLCVHCWCCCCFWCTCSFVTGTTNQPMPVNSISSIFSSLPRSLLISWSAVNGHQRLRTSNITTSGGGGAHSDRSASLSGESFSASHQHHLLLHDHHHHRHSDPHFCHFCRLFVSSRASLR